LFHIRLQLAVLHYGKIGAKGIGDWGAERDIWTNTTEIENIV